jgi:hypothetical protein
MSGAAFHPELLALCGFRCEATLKDKRRTHLGMLRDTLLFGITTPA